MPRFISRGSATPVNDREETSPGLSCDLDGESVFLWTYALNFVDTPAQNTVLDALPHSQASQFLNFRAYVSVPASPGLARFFNLPSTGVLGYFHAVPTGLHSPIS
jgi:hypothetical protein